MEIIAADSVVHCGDVLTARIRAKAVDVLVATVQFLGFARFNRQLVMTGLLQQPVSGMGGGQYGNEAQFDPDRIPTFYAPPNVLIANLLVRDELEYRWSLKIPGGLIPSLECHSVSVYYFIRLVVQTNAGEQTLHEHRVRLLPGFRDDGGGSPVQASLEFLRPLLLRSDRSRSSSEHHEPATTAINCNQNQSAESFMSYALNEALSSKTYSLQRGEAFLGDVRLSKSAFRMGEVVEVLLRFEKTNSHPRHYPKQLKATVQFIESIHEPYFRQQSHIARVMRTVEIILDGVVETGFALSLPVDEYCALASDIVSCSWVLDLTLSCQAADRPDELIIVACQIPLTVLPNIALLRYNK